MSPRSAWRALAVRPLLGGCGAALVLTAAGLGRVDGPSDAVLLLRGVAVLLACAVAWSVDDAAACVLAASPTPLRRRVLAPVAAASAVVGVAWAAVLTAVALRVHGVPVLGLTAQLLGTGAVGVALAAALRRWRSVDEPGVLAAPFVVGAVVATSQRPRRWALFVPGPDMPGWDAAAVRWLAVVVLAAGVVVLATRDPAARSEWAARGSNPEPEA